MSEPQRVFLFESIVPSDGTSASLRHLIGFLFYPYQQLQESTATNFNQLSLTLKLSILLASKYGFEPARFLILASHIGANGSVSKGVVEGLLTLPFCLNDFSVSSSLSKMVLNGDNAQWLTRSAKISHDPIFVINSCILLEKLGYFDTELSMKVASLDHYTYCMRQVRKILSTPFALENIIVLNCMKSFALERENLRELTEIARVSPNSIYVANTGFLFKMLDRLDLAEEMFTKGNILGSRRLAIELLFLKFDQAPGGDLSFFNLPENDPLELKAYGLWKLAQCYRYGRKIDRNLPQANTYYLQAVSISASNPQKCFPEIHYDAGSFALYCALSSTNPDQKKLALDHAVQHFRIAGNHGMEEAFTREDEVTTIHPELSYSSGIFNGIAQRAAIAGYLKIAQGILQRHALSTPTSMIDLKAWSDAEQVDIDFTKIFKEIKW